MQNYSLQYLKSVLPLHNTILVIISALGFLCMVAGFVAVLSNDYSDTSISMFGVEMTTNHVGITLMILGLVIPYITAKCILRSIKDLVTYSSWKSD